MRGWLLGCQGHLGKGLKHFLGCLRRHRKNLAVKFPECLVVVFNPNLLELMLRINEGGCLSGCTPKMLNIWIDKGCLNSGGCWLTTEIKKVPFIHWLFYVIPKDVALLFVKHSRIRPIENSNILLP